MHSFAPALRWLLLMKMCGVYSLACTPEDPVKESSTATDAPGDSDHPEDLEDSGAAGDDSASPETDCDGDPECDGFYLHDNGVTVLCPDAEVGAMGQVNIRA